MSALQARNQCYEATQVCKQFMWPVGVSLSCEDDLQASFDHLAESFSIKKFSSKHFACL